MTKARRNKGPAITAQTAALASASSGEPLIAAPALGVAQSGLEHFSFCPQCGRRQVEGRRYCLACQFDFARLEGLISGPSGPIAQPTQAGPGGPGGTFSRAGSRWTSGPLRFAIIAVVILGLGDGLPLILGTATYPLASVIIIMLVWFFILWGGASLVLNGYRAWQAWQARRPGPVR